MYVLKTVIPTYVIWPEKKKFDHKKNNNLKKMHLVSEKKEKTCVDAVWDIQSEVT